MLTTRPPRARHHGSISPGGTAETAGSGGSAGSAGSAIDALITRCRLTGLASVGRFGGDEHILRSAGIPLLMAAVVAGGPGWTTYFVEPGDTLTAIARRHGTDVRALARLNGVSTPDELLAGARLTVPVPPVDPQSSARRKASASGLHPVGHSGVPMVTYRVREGDTVSGIAARAGTSERAILSANGVKNAGLIRIGQVLVLPAISTSLSATTSLAERRSTTRPVVYVVRDGDTLLAVTLRFGVPLATVLKANQLSIDDLIVPGRKLILPGAKAATRRTGSGASSISVHVIRRGETVTAIARRYGVPVPAVLTLNHLGSRSIIYPGRRLLIPAGNGEVATTRRRDATTAFTGRTYPGAVLTAAEANRQALKKRSTPSPADAREMVRAAALKYGLDPALALAVAQVESGFNHRKVSQANAIGMMQVVPSTGAWSSTVVGHRLDLLDAHDNITAGVVLLAGLYNATHDTGTTLAGYYQGLDSVRKHGMFADTRRYVATVRTLSHRFQ